MYRLQGSQIQQEKKRNTLSEIMTPINKSTPNLLLGFDANQPKLFLESSFPTHKVASFPVKDDVISTFPNNPASCNHDLSENAMTKGSPSFNYHVKGIQIQVPMDV